MKKVGKKANRMKRFLVIFVLLFTAAFVYTWFKPNNTVIPAYDSTRLNLVIGEKALKSDGVRVMNGEILLALDTIERYIDPYIYWDESLKKVTITTSDRVLRMKTESLDALINNKPLKLNIPAEIHNNRVYVPIEVLADLYNINVNFIKDKNIVIVDKRSELIKVAVPVEKGAVVRSGMSRKNPIYRKFNINSTSSGTKAAEEDTLRIFNETGKWYLVRTTEGILGYIEKKSVKVSEVKTPSGDQEDIKQPVKVKEPVKGHVSLAWDMMNGEQLKEKIDGLDVLSPVWFYLSDTKGEISNKASLKYVRWAHEKGYRVWVLFGNGSLGPAKTKIVLNNTDTRDTIIRQLLTYASMYGFDGVNFDFENMYESDKRAYTQFIREAAVLLREQGLTVTVDVGVPDGSEFFSKCYDHKALGEAVDYLAVMTYDQHWSTSPVAGSVAQITWVEKYLKKTLELVPREKLLLGLPFYTRLWKEQADSDGAIKVSSPRPLSMDEAKAMIVDNSAEVEWDEESGQFYTSFLQENVTYKIWVEDANSINLRTALVLKYGLAGTAAWSRSFEEPEIWEVIRKNLKDYKTYNDWKKDNETKKASINLD